MPQLRPILAAESFYDVSFPVNGIDRAQGFAMQRKATTPVGKNVRAFEPTTDRARGGQRAGLRQYVAAQVSGANPIQHLNSVVTTKPGSGSGGVQTSTSGRVVTLVAVSQGNVKIANAGDTAWVTPTNGTGALVSSGVIQSAANQQKLFFADGVSKKYYDPSDNTVHGWTPTAGNLPVDSGSHHPRLICTWRGRTVMSGLLLDGQDIFMSAKDDPFNYDYFPTLITPTQAVSGQNAPIGLVGDIVTTLIPYTDDVLVVGGDHTVWMIVGDPMAGGQMDKVSDAIGMAWGAPWCTDPYGNIYFVSNRTGIYMMRPGEQPQRISQQIEQLLLPINTGTNTIRMSWNDRFQGLRVYVTPTAAAGATTHFFWEHRTNAWWTDVHANSNHDPLCATTFDGNTPGDRVELIGSWDGYVRAIDPTATTDDGVAIASSVVLGPILTADLDEMLLKDLQAVLGSASGDVTFSVFVGATAEQALASTAVLTGTWASGRNLSNFVRRSAHAIWIQISATNPWAMEQIRARIAGTGKVRRRGR